MKKTYLLIMLAVIPLLFSSCINIERNIIINKDGTGTEMQKMDLGREFFDLMISMASSFDTSKTASIRDSLYNDTQFTESTREKFESNEGVKLINLQSRINPDSSMTFEVEYTFDNVEKIISDLTPDKGGDNEAKLSRSEVKYTESNGRINFSYKHIPVKDTTEIGMSDEQKKSFSYLFKERFMIFRIEFPYIVGTTNGEKINDNVVLWKYPMDKLYLYSDSLELKAELLKD